MRLMTPLVSFIRKVDEQILMPDLIAKATDENLTSENWEYILVQSCHYFEAWNMVLIFPRMSVIESIQRIQGMNSPAV